MFDIIISKIKNSKWFLVILLKILQFDWLMKCKDIVIMTLQGAKTIFLDTWYATMEKM